MLFNSLRNILLWNITLVSAAQTIGSACAIAMDDFCYSFMPNQSHIRGLNICFHFMYKHSPFGVCHYFIDLGVHIVGCYRLNVGSFSVRLCFSLIYLLLRGQVHVDMTYSSFRNVNIKYSHLIVNFPFLYFPGFMLIVSSF